MSWIDAAENRIVIVCGDGQRFEPLWKPSSKGIEFNVTEFQFSNVEGTLVRRKEMQGRRFPLELYFQGEDHLEQAEAFETSAKDKRAWNILHPYYGSIFVQPISIQFGNSSFNVTQLILEVVETILEDAPRTTVDRVTDIRDRAQIVNSNLESNFSNQIAVDSAAATQGVQYNDAVFMAASGDIPNQTDSDNYFNAYKFANSQLISQTNTPLQKIRAINSFIQAPFLFEQTVISRIGVFEQQISQLNSSVSTLTNPNGKRIYQTYLSSLLVGLGLASINPLPNDYTTRSQVIEVIERILAQYNTFILNLDSLQTLTGSTPTSFIPDANILETLSGFIKFTTANLLLIASNARQEVTHILEDDSNAILLTHRFYGLDANDENLQLFIETNNIGSKELFKLEKGRLITYLI
jgi:hypothetical protein